MRHQCTDQIVLGKLYIVLGDNKCAINRDSILIWDDWPHRMYQIEVAVDLEDTIFDVEISSGLDVLNHFFNSICPSLFSIEEHPDSLAGINHIFITVYI